MATKKRETGKRKVKVNKLKVERDKVEDLSDKDSKRVRGGQTAINVSKAPGK